jgi:hypothetical protein
MKNPIEYHNARAYRDAVNAGKIPAPKSSETNPEISNRRYFASALGHGSSAAGFRDYMNKAA